MRLSNRALVAKTFLVAALLLSLGTVQAEAGWQYAQWGMSPEQVIAASNGEATSATTLRRKTAIFVNWLRRLQQNTSQGLGVPKIGLAF